LLQLSFTTTTSVTLVGWLREPLVPVMLIVKVPVGVVVAVLTVRVDVVPVAGLGLKLAVTPGGRVPTLRVTAPLKPLVRVIVMV
jgi:hypothetical protein